MVAAKAGAVDHLPLEGGGCADVETISVGGGEGSRTYSSIGVSGGAFTPSQPSPLQGEGYVRVQRPKPFNGRTQKQATALRLTTTDAERALWQLLRGKALGVKFRRQQPIGNYIVDFINFDMKLVIEADGGQHADSAHDAKRDNFLRREGYHVLRFWNNEVLGNPEGVFDVIHGWIQNHLPSVILKKSGEARS